MKNLLLLLAFLLSSFISFGIGPIIGPSGACQGIAVTLSDTTVGGAWTSSDTTIASVSPSGIVYAHLAGAVTISYTVGSSSVTALFTVDASPAIWGTASICRSGFDTLHSSLSGGTWASSDTTIGTITAGGLFYGISMGTDTLTYTMASGCSAAMPVLVDGIPNLIITGHMGVCAFEDTLVASCSLPYYVFTWHASGGIPDSVSGISCSVCNSNIVRCTHSRTLWAVTTSASGCPDSVSYFVDADRIGGVVAPVVTSTYIPPSWDAKVWLIEYNPADSTITAVDSTMACPNRFYLFSDVPAGNYMVKSPIPLPGYTRWQRIYSHLRFFNFLLGFFTNYKSYP